MVAWRMPRCPSYQKKNTRFKKQPTQYHLDEFPKEYARARRVFRGSLETSWQNYVSKLNSRTPIKKHGI